MRTRTKLHVLDDALVAIRTLRPLVEKIRAKDRSLSEQIRDAASSAALNIGEAEYSDAGNQRARLYTASGSANEARTGLQVAAGWGYVADAEAEEADAKLDAVMAQLYRLLNR